MLTRRQFVTATSCTFLGAPLANAKGPLVFNAEAEEVTQNAEQARSGIAQDTINMQWLTKEFWNAPRELWLYRRDTRENIRETYYQNGQVNVPGYIRICQVLRDVHKNKAVQIDLVLLDILRGIQGYYDLKNYSKPIVVLSGFRTKETNQALENAAKNSMHLIGRAVDMYIPTIPLKDVLWFGDFFKAGGVGFYPSNGFIHLDTGRVRKWVGTTGKR